MRGKRFSATLERDMAKEEAKATSRRSAAGRRQAQHAARRQLARGRAPHRIGNGLRHLLDSRIEPIDSRHSLSKGMDPAKPLPGPGGRHPWPPGDRRPASPRRPLERLFVFLALACLGGVLVIKAVRAGFEDTLWMDEVYSLEMASSELPRLADLAVQDLHPPLYYLALHGWLAGLDLLSIPRSIGAARTLNLAVWIVLVVTAWRILTAALGRPLGALGALLIGASAHLVQFTQDARSYGFAEAGLAICALLVARDLLDEAPMPRSTLVRTGAYALSASVAAWSHLLSWLLLALLGAAWLLLRWRFLRARERVWYAPPLVASVATALLVSPWVPVARDRAAALREAAPQWMTPASFANLGRVLWEWLPFGRDGFPGTPLPRALALALGVLSLVPLVLLALPVRRSKGREQEARQVRSRWLAAALAATGLIFVAVLWSSSRCGWLTLFHGPRYPCLAMAFWVPALLLAAVGRSGPGRRPVLALLPLAPWLLASGAALTSIATPPARSLAAEFQAAAISLENGTALPVFHLQEELAPYLRRTLAALRSRPAAELPCSLFTGDALLIGLNRWRELESPEALRVHWAIAYGLVRAVGTRPVPAEYASFEISRVAIGSSADPVLRKWCDGELSLSRGRHPPDGVAVAAPEEQRYRDGWSYLEFDRELRPYRWTRSPEAVLRFAGKLRGERVRVRLEGASRPAEAREPRLRVRSRQGTTLFDAPLEPGAFAVTFEPPPFRDHRELTVLTIESEVTPVTVGASPEASYQRTIGILLREATIEPSHQP